MYLKIPEKRRNELKQKNILILYEDVSSKIITDICDDILELCSKRRSKRSKEITLVINSGGGGLGTSLFFANFLRTLPKNISVNAVVTGFCASAAIVLLQCCKKRLSLPHSLFQIHNPNITVRSSDDENCDEKIRLTLQGARQIKEHALQIECERTGISREKWLKLAKEGDLVGSPLITTEIALDLNLIDKVIDTFEIF